MLLSMQQFFTLCPLSRHAEIRFYHTSIFFCRFNVCNSLPIKIPPYLPLYKTCVYYQPVAYTLATDIRRYSIFVEGSLAVNYNMVSVKQIYINNIMKLFEKTRISDIIIIYNYIYLRIIIFICLLSKYNYY